MDNNRQIKFDELPNLREFVSEMEDDFDRFPLPICFDPAEEQRELWRRHCHIEAVCKRYLQIFSPKIVGTIHQ